MDFKVVGADGAASGVLLVLEHASGDTASGLALTAFWGKTVKVCAEVPASSDFFQHGLLRRAGALLCRLLLGNLGNLR